LSGFLAWRNLHNAIFSTVYGEGESYLSETSGLSYFVACGWRFWKWSSTSLTNKVIMTKKCLLLFFHLSRIFSPSPSSPLKHASYASHCSIYLKFSTHIIWCFKTFQAGLTSQMNKCPPRKGWINDLFF